MKPSPNDLCLCRHARKDHCKGDVRHASYKHTGRPAEYQDVVTCATTHCEAAVCCCISFRAAEVAVEIHPEAQAA